MSQPVLGRAQLLQIVASLPQSEWAAAARATGFELRAEKPEQPAKAVGSAAPAPEPTAEKLPEPTRYRSSDLPDQPFWRVTAQRLLSEAEWPSGAPSWLEEAQPWQCVPQSDPDISPPPLQALTPRARQARFLRQQLATPQRGGHLDLSRLCRQLAERRIPARLPRLERASWPGRVSLVQDISPGLRPYHDDFRRWESQLRHILGERLESAGHP